MQTIKINKNGRKKIQLGEFEIWYDDKNFASLLIFNKNLNNMKTTITPNEKTRIEANTVIMNNGETTTDYRLQSNAVNIWDYPNP